MEKDTTKPLSKVIRIDESEIFYTLKEAQVVIEHWRNHYNTRRPHSALGYRPPAPEVVMPKGMNRGVETGQMVA